MWTCINCFPDKKSVDLLLLQLFTSLYSHYLPKNKGEIYSTEKINFLSLVPTFERKLLLVKLQVQRSYLGPLCTWGFFVCSHLHRVSRMNCKVLWGTIACQPVQEFPCPARRALLEPEKPRALLWGAPMWPGCPLLPAQGAPAVQNFHYNWDWLLLPHEVDLWRRCENSQDIGM